MSDDEYYFEDDYGGEAGEDDCEEESEIEGLYADAKTAADKGVTEAKKLFLGVIAADSDHGRWTFKSLKGIYRAATRHRDVPVMLEYYKKALEFRYDDLTRNDTEKQINKFLDRTSHFPADVVKKIYEMTLEEVCKDKKSFDKLWFNTKLKLSNVAFAEGRLDEVAQDLVFLHEWCEQGPQAEQRKATQKITVLALEMQLHTERFDATKIRALYTAAMSIKSAIPPPRALGIIRESGGKMHMRQGQWTEAHDAFVQAFRSFDEAGDIRRVACLKYLVLATMLSASKINPFDSPEAKSYQKHPDIVAMTELIQASANNDIKKFNEVLEGSSSIKEDSFLFSYVQPLLRQVRCQALPIITKPYRTIRMAYLAQELGVAPDEAESLCLSVILDGKLSAAVDQEQGVLVLSEKAEPGALDRAAIFESISRAEGSLLNTVATRAYSVQRMAAVF